MYLTALTKETYFISADNGFILKKINQSVNVKKNNPRVTCKQAMQIQPKRLVRPGHLAGNFETALLILIYFSKYETIVSRNGSPLGYSEQDTSTVIIDAFEF